MRTLVLAVILATLFAIVPDAQAVAQRCVAPPGTGAVDEYCETIPTGKGDRAPSDAGPSGLSRETVGRLATSGSAGVGLAQAVGVDPTELAAAGARRHKLRDRQVPAVAIPNAPSANPLNAVRHAVGGNSTIGKGFIVAVFLTVLGMAGWAWIVWRRSARP